MDRQARHETLLELEREAWSRQVVVAGLDEAGAGPIAGPIVAGCAVIDEAGAAELVGVDDSKSLSAKARAAHAERIRQHAVAWAVAEASVQEIDRYNVLRAGLMAMRRALESVQAQVEVQELFLDAREIPEVRMPQHNLVKGDARSLSIAAASILAKEARDAIMVGAGAELPAYGFERHKGYGTAEHLAALRAHGATAWHRRSFEPLRTMLSQLSLF
ncbi:MAG: ribonuclease HII [Deltaproteobacteria bacterium]